MGKTIGTTAVICALVLMITPLFAGAEGAYFGSHPAEDVYLIQTTRHTCTLIAATMMLRNYYSMRGFPGGDVSEKLVRKAAWSKRGGLSRHFTVVDMEVECSAEILDAVDKRLYLIMCLKLWPEGVVVYDTGAPHAIWVFGYDEDSDTFYCADTISDRGGRAISLAESSLKGKTQDEKIRSIDRIWHIL